MKKICFATNNEHKINEVKLILGNLYHVLSLKDIGCFEDLQETGNTLEHNSAQKARYVFEKYQIACFSDDTGLEIESLENKPGVDSAYYSGSRIATENNKKVLAQLEGITNRKAVFKTVITFISQNTEIQFTGLIEGEITTTLPNIEGFGYDPIFKPFGQTLNFAQMSIDEKNKISHRAIAISKLVAYLNIRSDL